MQLTEFGPTPPAEVYVRITAEAFWERFTSAELVDFDVAMQHDSAATNQAKKDAAKLRIFKADTDASGFRNLTKTKVRNFVLGLPLSILAAGRATIILDTPITEDEAFKR
jgi:hypothetical protein